jgi:hypothetical protein
MDAIRNGSGVGAHNVILAPGAVNVSCRVQPPDDDVSQPDPQVLRWKRKPRWLRHADRAKTVFRAVGRRAQAVVWAYGTGLVTPGATGHQAHTPFSFGMMAETALYASRRSWICLANSSMKTIRRDTTPLRVFSV